MNQVLAAKRELTWQSIVAAFFVSSIISAAYPYIVLKLGMGPNVSVLSAFLGALVLLVIARKTHGQNQLMNNIVQTAGTSATSTAFMCVVAAAFGYLDANETVDVHVRISRWDMFTWLSCSGTIGVFISALFRSYFMNDPKMIFADGVAAAETVKVLDGRGAEGRSKLQTIGLGAASGAVVSFLREGLAWIPMTWFAQPFKIGMEWSLLSIGTGMLITLRVATWMLVGTLAVWAFGSTIMDAVGLEIVRASIAPQHLAQCNGILGAAELTKAQGSFMAAHCGLLGQYRGGGHYPILMLWLMWPATAMMIASALTALLLRWRSIVEMFRTLRTGSRAHTEMSLRTIVIGTLTLTIILAMLQYSHFGVPHLQTIASVLLAIPLVLVGVRVLGETNQGPVSLMANGAQALFRLFSPHVAHNLVAAGMAGDIHAQGEGTMQDFKTGKILGSTPRILTWVQLCAIPIGAAAVAIMYPILVAKYPLGEELTAPTGLKLANMAVLMSKGVSALPSGAFAATVIAFVAGIIFQLLEDKGPKRLRMWLPSSVAFGFALILPGALNIPIFVGSLMGWIWRRQSPANHEHHAITLASGFIGGEALIAGLLLPILFFFGIM